LQIQDSTRRMGLALSTACLILFGCSNWPGAHASAAEMQDELAAHVRFLSQPKLQGRKTRTAGARLARQYIEKEFQTYRLLPWGKAKSYELSFGLGKNLVGIVPGSDTKVSGEIVLLSAHYDHLGKDRKGRICPGAADNASGVAVLLEAARRFGLAEQRAKRTIAFAAFDAEEQMLLGSFAFCCRTDVEQAKLVAVVNVDMLGRDFLDAIPNTVFVAGTEGYPALQARVRRLGSAADIRVLPLGSDLIGPRSDHVAFESGHIPCLFFSCGTFRDYHEPGDTAAKLDYPNLERSARVILQTVDALANGDAIPPSVGSGCDVGELTSVQAVVSELCRDPLKAGIKTNDISALVSLKGRVDKLLDTGDYNPRTREQLVLEATHSLGRYFLPFGDQGPAGAERAIWLSVVPYLEHIYLNYRRELREGQKQLIAQVLKNPPGLFHSVPAFHYEIYDIPADDISVVSTGADCLALHALGINFTLAVRGRPSIWPWGALQVGFYGSFETLDCEGSRKQLVDYCLLYVRAEQTNQLQTAAIRRVLSAVSGSEPPGGYKEWLRARLAQGRYAGETEWLLSCFSSSNPELVNEALGAARGSQDHRVWNAVREIMLNPNARPDVRAHAIQLAVSHPDKTTLLALTEVLDDPHPVWVREYCPQFKPGYPLADRTAFQTLRPFLENTLSQRANTIGQTALENLKKATKRNLGRDAQKWKAFVEKSR